MYNRAIDRARRLPDCPPPPQPVQPASGPTIAHRAVVKLIDALPALGADAALVCDDAGIDPAAFAQVDGRAPLSVLHALWEAACRQRRRDDLPLVLAQRYAPGDYALLGFVAMSSSTLGDALRQVERYMPLWTDDPEISLDEAGRLAVHYRTRVANRPGLQRATEATLAEVLQGARQSTARRIVPRAVSFNHPAPSFLPSPTTFDEFFGAPVRFAQPETAMCFDPADLALPLPQLDPQLGSFLQQLACSALQRHRARDGLLERMRQIVADELKRGVPSIDVVARRMAMSERTLRRRLEDEGTNFRELIDRVRAELAADYMNDRHLPLSEIAFLLGFSEPSAFHRAFKRWTGSTPSSWRHRRAE